MGTVLLDLATNQLASVLMFGTTALIMTTKKMETLMKPFFDQMTPNCALGALTISLFANMIFTVAPSL